MLTGAFLSERILLATPKTEGDSNYRFSPRRRTVLQPSSFWWNGASGFFLATRLGVVVRGSAGTVWYGKVGWAWDERLKHRDSFKE